MNVLKKVIRDIIIGPDQFISSTTEYRNAMLRGLIAMIGLIIGVLYIFVDAINDVHAGYPVYVSLAVLSLLTLWLNRIGKYMWASALLVLVSNGVLFIFAASEGPSMGVFFFFITIGLATLVLFGYSNRNVGIVLALISYGIAMVAYFGRPQILPVVAVTEEYTSISFVTNFTTAYFVAALVLYFSIQLHHDTETDLRNSEQSLRLTSQELKRSRERFQMAVEGTRAGLYEWNRVSGTLYLGNYFKRVLGYDESDLSDLTFPDFRAMIHPDDLPQFDASLEHYLKSKEPYQTELRLRTKGGSYKWVADSGVARLDENGELISLVGSIIDIEERKMAEQQIRLQNDLLAKANDELDRFVYSASHDLRAPLSSLLGLISIAEKTDNREEVMLCMEMMKKRVVTMEGFIKEITDYSRNSRLRVERQPVHIRSLVQEVVESLKYTNGAERIRIDLEMDPDLTFITDPGRLKVVLNNLIANAIKYHDLTKEDPYIRLKAFANGKSNEISVSDNGQGIPREHMNHIFNMFYRASENSEGSGLGLYIVKETLTKLSGTIHVESEYQKGSVFRVELPT
ncbi:MAG TPA: ATP-binding protein [Cyclobacteriaceae bacterium]|nr:ATP-binding protein [Cyclobacteriaceae bacterium]